MRIFEVPQGVTLVSLCPGHAGSSLQNPYFLSDLGVVGATFFWGLSSAPLFLPGQAIHPTGYPPGTLLRTCLWTSLTWLSCAGSTSLVGLAWSVPKDSSGREWAQVLESHLPPGGALALSHLCFIFPGQDPTISPTLGLPEEGWH